MVRGMANGGSKTTVTDNKKNKDAVKPYDRPMSLLWRFGSMLKEYLIPSWYRESPWQSTNTDPNGSEEEKETRESLLGRFRWTLKAFLIPSWYQESSWTSTNAADLSCNEGEGEPQEVVTRSRAKSFLPRFGSMLGEYLPSFCRESWQSTNPDLNENEEEEQEPQKSLLEWFGWLLIYFFTPSWFHESWLTTDADPNDNEEQEEPEETMSAVEVDQRRDGASIDQPGNQVGLPSSVLTELSAKVMRAVEDFLVLLRTARRFFFKSSASSTNSCAMTCGVRQGSILEPHLFVIYAIAPCPLGGVASGDHDKYADDIKITASVFSSSLSDLTLDRMSIELLIK